MNFNDIKNWVIPEGTVTKVTDSLNRVIWEKSTLADEYFYIEDISGSSNTLSIKKIASNAPTLTLYYSSNKTSWSSRTLSTTTQTIAIPANGKIYFKCTTSSLGNMYGGGLIFSNNKYANVGGNIMSLLKGDNFSGVNTISSYSFKQLFSNNSYLRNAKDLVLPTGIASDAYYSMFYHCTALLTAPALPGTYTSTNCYYRMFEGCTSLKTAPTLKAKTVADYCYYQMFKDCTQLNSVTTYADDISATNCLYIWLQNVAATGTFHNLGSATYPSGDSGIPTGWTEVNS